MYTFIASGREIANAEDSPRSEADFSPNVAFIPITWAVCTENLIHVDEVAELPKLAQCITNTFGYDFRKGHGLHHHYVRI